MKLQLNVAKYPFLAMHIAILLELKLPPKVNYYLYNSRDCEGSFECSRFNLYIYIIIIKKEVKILAC